MTTLGVQASCGVSQLSDCGTAPIQPHFFPSLDSYGPQRAAEMELLFSRLLFAARGLARARVKTAPPVIGEEDPLNYCEECHMGSIHGVLSHAASCRVGAVLGIPDLICQTEPAAAGNLPNRRKEDWPVAGSVRAEDGRLSCANFGEPWHQSSDKFGIPYLHDDAGSFIQSSSTASERSLDEVLRIAACVNFCAGISTERLERELPLASAGRRRVHEIMHLRQALPWLGYLPVEADDSAVLL